MSRKLFVPLALMVACLATTCLISHQITSQEWNNRTGLTRLVSSRRALVDNKPTGVISNSSIYHVQVTAIHVDKAEFPLTKLLFKLTLRLALDAINAKLEPQRVKISLSFRSANTCSNQYAGAVAAEEYYRRRTRMFIVSGCDQAIRGVSRLASVWRVPVMTAAGFSSDLNNKSVHHTLVRVAFSLRSATEFLVKILKLFQWQRVNLIVDESDANSLALRGSIEQMLLDHRTTNYQANVNVVSLELQSLISIVDNNTTKSYNNYSLPDDRWPNEQTDQAVRFALKQCSLFSRVNILLVPQVHLRKFMLSVYDQNMANGLYTFINVPLLLLGSATSDSQADSSASANSTQSSYTASTGENAFVWRSLNSSRNLQAKKAFESLMSIYLKTPTGKAYLYFASKLSGLANSDYATTTQASRIVGSTDEHSAKIQLNINPYTASFYDCLQIYSVALNESLSAIEKETDESARRKLRLSLHPKISRSMRGRRYDNMLTGKMLINENGDREVDYTLDDLNHQNGKFQPVILFKGETKEIERLGRIQWSSDKTGEFDGLILLFIFLQCLFLIGENL